MNLNKPLAPQERMDAAFGNYFALSSLPRGIAGLAALRQCCQREGLCFCIPSETPFDL
jgi:hypothetical protein